MPKTTKPKGATSYKETAFGILPRTKVVALELEGVKKADLHNLSKLEQLIANALKESLEKI